MIFEVSIIGYLIGIIAGMIYYLDGWGPTPGGRGISTSRRYQGLAIIVAGGIISPALDKYMFGAEKYALFKGYLCGVASGWIVLFLGGMLLYVIWKNSRDSAPTSVISRLGQIAYSALEVISFGISENPQLQREQERQSLVDTVKTEDELAKLKERLRREDPNGYIEFEEQQLRRQQRNLELMTERLEQLKDSVSKAKQAPEEEARELLVLKNRVISTIREELELAHQRSSEDRERMQQVIGEYQRALHNQEDLRSELTKALEDFRRQAISKDQLSSVVSYQKLSQYESGGLLLGQFCVHDRQVKIYEGDIANVAADVIVSSDDNYLTMGGGVSMRIRTAGGMEVYKEAQRLVPLSLGDVVATTAGSLPAKAVFHGVVIDFDKAKGPSEEVVKTVVRRCIDKAATRGFRSVAFPLFGTGTGGFPAAVALELMLSVILSDFSRASHSVIQAVIVVYGTVARTIDVEAIIRRVETRTQT